MPVIIGINPVIEALEAGKNLDKIYILSGKSGQSIHRIYVLAKGLQIPVVQASRPKLESLAGGQKSQGVVALSPPIDYISLQDLVDKIQRSGEPGNLLMVDRVTDPHNFGAVIRSAEVFAAHGIIFSLRDSVPVTEQVMKSSAGAIFHTNICKVNNQAAAVNYLRKCGFWIYATSSHADKSLWDMDLTSAQLLIVGSEGKGVRQILRDNSDDAFRIPQAGRTESLNVSVATGIILAEVFRQRSGQK